MILTRMKPLRDGMPVTSMFTTTYCSISRMREESTFSCDLNYYGPQCQTFCKSDFRTFHCGENGEHKCLPGWYGPYCNKADMCFLKPCAPYARCSNVDGEEGRICYCNGGSGPECYRMPDPCEPSPCKNDGVCSKTGPHLEQFLCECHKPWHGPTCEQRYSACYFQEKLLKDTYENSTGEVCLNGGVCKDDPREFGYFCVCPIGWKGEHCGEEDYIVAIAVSIALIIILIIICVILFTFLRRRWSRRRLQSKDTRPSIFVPLRQQQQNYAESSGATQEPVAIKEDEYAMVQSNSAFPASAGKSYVGAIRYASLLWDKHSTSNRPSKSTEMQSSLETSVISPRPIDIATPLIGSEDEKPKSGHSIIDRPSKNMYERSREDDLEATRTPLPMRNTKTTPRSKKNPK